MSKTIYVVHPVDREFKKKARAEGLKIVDAQFAPKGAVIINPRAQERDNEVRTDQARTDQSNKPLTIAQIKELLVEKGIDIPAGVTKHADLLALLESNEDHGATGGKGNGEGNEGAKDLEEQK